MEHVTIDGYPAWHVSRRWIIVDKSDATAWRRRAERAEAALARAALDAAGKEVQRAE